MNNRSIINQDENCLVSISGKGILLKGYLVYSTASSVLSEGCSYLKNHSSDELIIELNDVLKIDSAGISVLLAWKRLADETNKKLQIVGAQEQARSLIKTNKLENILQQT